MLLCCLMNRTICDQHLIQFSVPNADMHSLAFTQDCQVLWACESNHREERQPHVPFIWNSSLRACWQPPSAAANSHGCLATFFCMCKRVWAIASISVLMHSCFCVYMYLCMNIGLCFCKCVVFIDMNSNNRQVGTAWPVPAWCPLVHNLLFFDPFFIISLPDRKKHMYS